MKQLSIERPPFVSVYDGEMGPSSTRLAMIIQSSPHTNFASIFYIDKQIIKQRVLLMGVIYGFK